MDMRGPVAASSNKEMQLTKPDGLLVGGRGAHVRCRRAIVFESGFAADLRCYAGILRNPSYERGGVQWPGLPGHRVRRPRAAPRGQGGARCERISARVFVLVGVTALARAVGDVHRVRPGSPTVSLEPRVLWDEDERRGRITARLAARWMLAPWRGVGNGPHNKAMQQTKRTEAGS